MLFTPIPGTIRLQLGQVTLTMTAEEHTGEEANGGGGGSLQCFVLQINDSKNKGVCEKGWKQTIEYKIIL